MLRKYTASVYESRMSDPIPIEESWKDVRPSPKPESTPEPAPPPPEPSLDELTERLISSLNLYTDACGGTFQEHALQWSVRLKTGIEASSDSYRFGHNVDGSNLRQCLLALQKYVREKFEYALNAQIEERRQCEKRAQDAIAAVERMQQALTKVGNKP